MQKKMYFNEILDKVDKMPLEEQNFIIEVLKNRNRERKREEIYKNARQTLDEYKKGLTSRGSVADLLRDMEND